MAFDGIVIASLVSELRRTILGGKINKIAQPEPDELMITIKNQKNQYRLLLSASASLPLIYLTENNKPGPLTAPNFCMLLRKHIGSGKIINITQPSMERIICFDIEHLNELGDLCRKKLIIEVMGKHSNLIFCDDEGKIIDSIKHVSAHMSSVREVLPGRSYFIPETQHKYNPLELTAEEFISVICEKPLAAAKAISSSITGISYVTAEEAVHRASLDGGVPMASLNEAEKQHLAGTFLRMIDEVKEESFVPNIVYCDKEPVEFSAIALTQYSDYTGIRDTDHPGVYKGKLTIVPFPSISQVLELYYAQKNIVSRIRQKSTDLRKVVQTSLERNIKKYDLQSKQMKDTEKKEKYRIYGELINTYGYGLEPGAKSFEALNYYTNEIITIPLDPTMTPGENAKKYFEKYSKLKRTAEALGTYLVETKNEIEHLESIATSLDIALAEEDLVQIKEELVQSGYIKRRNTGGKKARNTSKPFHYISSDGYDMYVGKNNYQNEELTFKFADGNDWWFHAKGQPGSHVIVKSRGDELPDRTFEEAGRLAAFYSKGRQAPKVEIDYIQKKHVKKPNGGKPGFVVYYTNYSLMIEPDISDIHQVNG
ncbi:MAG: NFACT family protein [Lachnospiraceae bacterium]|nr:NFACT family protein [Lachnospiraceae bacterium]